MSQNERKQKRINAIIDEAATKLKAEGVRYFIGVIDREPTGGKVYLQSDVRGEDFPCLLEVALPTMQDTINLGIWAGKLIAARAKCDKKPKEG